MPKYDELSIVNLYGKFKTDPKFMAYFPDRLPKGRLPDRKYFFNVLHTLYPVYVKQMIEHASNNRHVAASQSLEDAVIRVNDEWWQKLNANPFTSSKSIAHANSIRS